MTNVPWHQEVVSMAQQMVDILEHDWEIAAEHEHSCCVLLARKSKFKVVFCLVVRTRVCVLYACLFLS
jgi:tRNA wybutosine-synthesizing protein 1